MEEQQAPQPKEQDLKKTIPLMIAGAVVSLAIGVALMYFGLFNQCCGLGFLLVACVALYVPKLFGMTKIQFLVVFGVVFFAVLTLAGALMVSKPMFENNSDVSSFNDDGFSDVSIELVDGHATVTVSYSGTGTSPRVYLYQVQLVTYQMITKTSDEASAHDLTEISPGRYQATGIEVPSGYVYQLMFGYDNGEDAEKTSYVYYLGAADDSEITKFCLLYNMYNCGWIIAIFYLMLVLTTIMRKNLEKTRARMEAEGRLYPQGYGRCKECGSIVLPGETCCRKCGAYIEVPEELRHKKVDMVECSECGAEIPEDAKVCPKCGAVFDEEEEIVYVDADENAETEEKKE